MIIVFFMIFFFLKAINAFVVIHMEVKEQLQLAMLNAPEMPIRYAVDLTLTQFIKPYVEI
jgi:hypothetical protein